MENTSFNAFEYEKKHIVMLAESVRVASGKPKMNLQNLARTTAKYIENHKNTQHIKELKILIQEFLFLCDRIDLSAPANYLEA